MYQPLIQPTRRRFHPAPILLSIAIHAVVALVAILIWQWEDEDVEVEKKVVKPFEVSLIEEQEETPLPLDLPNVRPQVPTPSPEVAPPVENTPQEKPRQKEQKATPSPSQEPSAPTQPAQGEPTHKPINKKSSVYVDPDQARKSDFKISNQLFNESIGYQENKKLTQALRGQKRFLGVDDALQMAKVTLKNVTGGTIRPGNHTAVVDETAQEFLERLHRIIHPQWALKYIPMLNQTGSHSDPINNLDLNTEVELVLDGKSGKPLEIVIARSSKVVEFDTEAVLVTRKAAITGRVPESLWSYNGKVYIHWNYWRDQKQCGIFGANVYILNEVGEKVSEVQGIDREHL